MAQRLTVNSKYESRYGGGWVTAAQFLAEVMCERTAKKDKLEITPKFWNTVRWAGVFLKQLAHANKLLSIYDPSVVSAALRTREGKNIYSLGAPWLINILKIEKNNVKKIELANTKEAKDLSIRLPFNGSKSLISKIKDLDR